MVAKAIREGKPILNSPRSKKQMTGIRNCAWRRGNGWYRVTIVHRANLRGDPGEPDIIHSLLIQKSTIKRGSDFAVYRSPRELAREEQAYYDRFPIQWPGDTLVATAMSFIPAGLRYLRAATDIVTHMARTQKLTH
jgi:hypothetical protein